MHDGACPGLDFGGLLRTRPSAEAAPDLIPGMPHRPFATATTPPKETVPTIGTRIRAGLSPTRGRSRFFITGGSDMTTTSIDRACPAPDAGRDRAQGRGQAAGAHHEGACGEDGRESASYLSQIANGAQAVDSQDAREGRGGAWERSPGREPSTAREAW